MKTIAFLILTTTATFTHATEDPSAILRHTSIEFIRVREKLLFGYHWEQAYDGFLALAPPLIPLTQIHQTGTFPYRPGQYQIDRGAHWYLAKIAKAAGNILQNYWTEPGSTPCERYEEALAYFKTAEVEYLLGSFPNIATSMRGRQRAVQTKLTELGCS